MLSHFIAHPSEGEDYALALPHLDGAQQRIEGGRVDKVHGLGIKKDMPGWRMARSQRSLHPLLVVVNAGEEKENESLQESEEARSSADFQKSRETGVDGATNLQDRGEEEGDSDNLQDGGEASSSVRADRQDRGEAVIGEDNASVAESPLDYSGSLTEASTSNPNSPP